jgi:hypothetical protein
METRPEVIDELRLLFQNGATPSRLIRHVAERHPAEPALHALIQEYFREAFAVPLVRGLKPHDEYESVDLRYAFLNEQLVHEMIEKRPEWDRGPAGAANGRQPWLDSLVATSDPDRIRQAQSMPFPELSQSWHRLTAKEQAFIQRSIASANGLYETVKILARLAEHLQQRVAELEKPSAEPHTRPR